MIDYFDVHPIISALIGIGVGSIFVILSEIFIDQTIVKVISAIIFIVVFLCAVAFVICNRELKEHHIDPSPYILTCESVGDVQRCENVEVVCYEEYSHTLWCYKK